MKFEVIKTEERWNEVIKNVNVIDVYYTYEYCTSSAKLQNGQPELLYYENDQGNILYPYVRREIQTSLPIKVYDIITPYGYGGPLLEGDAQVLTDFRKEFYKYCKEESIVSEVIAFHPIIKNASTMKNHCNLQFIRKTTAVDLTDSMEEIRQNYSSMNKRNLRKAQKSGLVCEEVEKTLENIKMFFSIYNKTMNRQHSSSFYYFPLSVVKRQLLDTAVSKSHLLFVTLNGKVIAATIMFTTERFAHYHLGGSEEEHLYLRPNNLIFDFMIELSKEAGCETLHLGGGYTNNDGLFKYKTSFTNENIFDYYLGEKILDPDVYESLVDEKKQSIHYTRSYFPQYRNVL